MKKKYTFYKKAICKAESENGKKYNHLTILGIDYEKTRDQYFNGSYNRVFVKVKCDCEEGNIHVVPLPSVKYGHIKSCGCLRFNNPLNVENLTGHKFGRLTVIERDIERDRASTNSQAHWLCKCDCGNPKLSSVTTYTLKSGGTISCGCYASEQIARKNKLYSSKTNRIRDGNDGTITLYDDDNNECLIDKEDYPIIKNWYWRKLNKRGDISKGYWATNSKIDDSYNKSIIQIHQVIAKIKYGEYDSKSVFPDHLSRDTNDNRKCNILLKTNADNCKNRSRSKSNSSGKTGVSFNNDNEKWCAYITVSYKTNFLGYFSNYDEAVKARKLAEIKYGFSCDDVVAPYDEVNL